MFMFSVDFPRFYMNLFKSCAWYLFTGNRGSSCFIFIQLKDCTYMLENTIFSKFRLTEKSNWKRTLDFGVYFMQFFERIDENINKILPRWCFKLWVTSFATFKFTSNLRWNMSFHLNRTFLCDVNVTSAVYCVQHLVCSFTIKKLLTTFLAMLYCFE